MILRQKIFNRRTMFVIYCIYNDIYPNHFYVGHTKNFKNRKKDHKNRCNNPTNERYNLKVYQFIRENGGWENWTMELLEDLGDITEDDAEFREEYWRVFLQADLNSYRAYRTEQERIQQKKDLCKAWKIENREHDLERMSDWRKANPEHAREWRVENHEHILEYQRQYRAAKRSSI